MRLAIAIFAAAIAISPAAASENSSIGVVQAFVAALVQDKQAAASMIATNAEFGVGDVGGSFDLALLDMLTADCSFDATVPTAHSLGIEGRAITVVDVAINCEVDGRPSSALPAQFMVEHDRIVGLYLPVKSALMELSDTSESENN